MHIIHIIFRNWLVSLSLFTPSKLLAFFRHSATLFFISLSRLVVNFGWLIIIHGVIFCVFGELIAKIISAQGTITKTASPGVHILILVQSVLWFLITSAFLLIIRKNDSLDIKNYFRLFFFRYIQLLFAVSAVIFIGLYLLIVGGITKIPSLSPIFLMAMESA